MRGRATGKAAYETHKKVVLLHATNGIEDTRKLRYEHLMAFTKIMSVLAPTYRKTPKERDMMLAEIVEAAEAAGRKQGLSAATIKRNLRSLGQFINHARSERLSLDPLWTHAMCAASSRPRLAGLPEHGAPDPVRRSRHQGRALLIATDGRRYRR